MGGNINGRLRDAPFTSASLAVASCLSFLQLLPAHASCATRPDSTDRSEVQQDRAISSSASRDQGALPKVAIKERMTAVDSVLGCVRSRTFRRVGAVVLVFSLTAGLMLAIFHFTPEHDLHRLSKNIGEVVGIRPGEKARIPTCKSISYAGSAGIWRDAQEKYANLRDDKFTYVQGTVPPFPRYTGRRRQIYLCMLVELSKYSRKKSRTNTAGMLVLCASYLRVDGMI